MTSVCIVGLVLEYLQLLSGMMQIRVEWGPPLSDWSNMMEVMLLKEVDFLAFGCLFGHSPFVIYMFKTVWPLLLLVGFGIMILIDRWSAPAPYPSTFIPAFIVLILSYSGASDLLVVKTSRRSCLRSDWVSSPCIRPSPYRC
jgi:hypothetical protein